MKHHLTPILILMILLVCFSSSCSTPSQPAEDQVQITDLLGRQVSVPATVERVVAIGPGALRIYTYIGNLDHLVGVEEMEKGDVSGKPYMHVHPELAELPTIGQGGPNNTPDSERIVTVNPDIIFSTYAAEAAAVDELQSQTGIPVVVIRYSPAGYGVTDIYGNDVKESINLVGQVLGVPERAQAVIDFIQQTEEDLADRTKDIPDDERPSVYVGGLGSKGTHGLESTQGEYSLLDAVYANNVVDEIGVSGSIMVDKEQILIWDPDFIFIDQGGFAAVMEDYQKNPDFYESLSAVRNGNLFSQLPYNFYNTNLGTAIADAYYLGKILYPEAFDDIDPAEKADEIYVALLGEPAYAFLEQTFGGFGQLELEN